MAADLSHALNVSTNTGRLWGGEQRGGEELTAGMGDDATIRLDADLPPVSMTSGLVGSEQLTTVNRAVGLLIGQGHLPGDAHDLLRRGALAVGLDADRFAARLLGR